MCNTTPLLTAAIHTDLETVRYLIDNGANIHAVNKDNDNALNFSIYGNLSSVAEYMLNNGVYYHRKRGKGKILHCIASYANIDTQKVFANAGLKDLDVEEKYHGQTALEIGQQRVDITPGWIAVFKEMLDNIRLARAYDPKTEALADSLIIEEHKQVQDSTISSVTKIQSNLQCGQNPIQSNPSPMDGLDHFIGLRLGYYLIMEGAQIQEIHRKKAWFYIAVLSCTRCRLISQLTW